MNQLTLIEQVLKLLPHWAAHLDTHVKDLTHWRNQAEDIINQNALDHILDAEKKMQAACEALESAFLTVKNDADTGEQP